MRKTDARIRYTQSVLKQALLSFLKEKPINKITVKEVCERAALFYALFHRGAGLQRRVQPQRRGDDPRLYAQAAEQHDPGYSGVAEGEDGWQITGLKRYERYA